jgi:predicted nucleotidyltransferase
MNNEYITAKIIEYFSSIENVYAVYLFGSRVKGKNREDSDVDIAVLFHDDIDSFERFQHKLDFANDLEELLELPVDIVDLRAADLFFIHQVMLNKKLVVDKNIHRRVQFEVNKRRQYFDMEPYLRLYYEQAMQRIEKRCNDCSLK